MREILIEKYTQPDYVEEGYNRILHHWYNKEGYCERKNNLPSCVVYMKNQTILHYHENGWWKRTKPYDNVTGKEIKHLMSDLGRTYRLCANWLEC